MRCRISGSSSGEVCRSSRGCCASPRTNWPIVGPGFDRGVGGGVYSVGGNVSAPRAIYSPDPSYSEEARKARYQGTVTLWLVVGSDGRAREVKVARSLGMG